MYLKYMEWIFAYNTSVFKYFLQLLYCENIEQN